MNISIIVPCRNEKRHIRQFLKSVLSQEIEPGWRFEILVADGLSDDGTREILEEYAQKVPAVRLVDNPGRIASTGLNAAIRASAGDIILRMDVHAVYAKDYVRQCVDTLARSGADNVGGPIVAEGEGPLGKAIAAAFHSPFSTGGGKAHDPAYEGEVDTVFNGCWRRSVFAKAGLFDPDLVRNQDDEFNLRLRRSGGRIWQSPQIKSSYTPRSSLRALFKQYLQYGFWKVAVIRKHRTVASWRHLAPVLFVASVTALALLIALAAALGMKTATAVITAALFLELGAYLLACFAMAAASARSLPPLAAVLLPAVFAAYHVGYGLGFAAGLFTRPRQGAAVAMPGRLFTALTR